MTASIDGDIVLNEGNTLDVVFPNERIHIFDGQSGTALKSREMPEETEVSKLSV